MKEVLTEAVLFDGRRYPPGTPASKFSEGQQVSLRRAKKLSVSAETEPAEPGDKEPGDKTKPKGKSKDKTKGNAGDKLNVDTDANVDVRLKDPAELNVGNTDSDSDPDNAISIKELGLPNQTAELMLGAGIETLGDAREFYAKHGSFNEPITGLGPAKNDEAVEILGLGTPEIGTPEIGADVNEEAQE